MDDLLGLPAHPLVVHLPVVLLPLAAIGAFAMMVRPSWYLRFRWPVLMITAAGAVGAILGARTGEELEELVEDSGTRAQRIAIHEHAEAGELARTVAILFLVAIVAYVVVPWVLARRSAPRPLSADVLDHRIESERTGAVRWIRRALMVAVAVTALGSVATVIDAGHSGADSVWGELDPVEDDD